MDEKKKILRKGVHHITYGNGVIINVREIKEKPYIDVFFFSSKEKRTFKYPYALEKSLSFCDCEELLELKKENKFIDQFGDILSDSDFNDELIMCSLCRNIFLFSAKEQKKYAINCWDDPRRCPKCRKIRRREKEIDEIKMVMKHEKKIASKKNQIHNTDGMNV